MKYQKPNRKEKILLIGFLTALLALALYNGFSETRSATRILYSSREGRYSWRADYHLLNGHQSKTLRTDTQPDVLRVVITTEAGQMALTIRDGEGNLIYHQENLATSAFDVEVPGSVTIRVDADHHRGSFDFSTK